MIKNILFDLDGTLTDPGLGITNSVMYALEKYNIKVSNREELYVFIGPPLVDSFMNFYGFSKEDADKAVGYYREYFKVTGLFENEVYPNAHKLLSTLKENGYVLAIATSKPDVFTLRILEHFDLLKYFDYVSAATLDGKISIKADIVKNAIEALGLNKEETIMVGDRKHDIIGANENGIASIGVLYGYGNKEEFEKENATYIVEEVLDILNVLNIK